MSTSANATPRDRRAAAISSQRWQYLRPYSSTFIGQTRNGDESHALAAPDLQRDDGALVEPGKQLVELLDALQLGVLALVHHGEQDVALAHVGLRVGPHVGDHQAALQAEALLLLG